MRGDFLHNSLVCALEKDFLRLGARTFREFFVRRIENSNKTGYIDLLIRIGDSKIAIEVELSARRVENDVWKAMTAEAELWLVVPNQIIARTVRRKLRTVLKEGNQIRTNLFTLGQARQEVRDRFPLIPVLNEPGNNEKKRSEEQ